ncbi:uracil-DNA glycosylase [Maribacter sp. CXY002]|uniref:uracil-DNA glycosylase n=1 Tax=Maribacter luteocoastalis TaxID=3407671 RepID=UPI003B677EFE
MKLVLEEDWRIRLEAQFGQPYFQELISFVETEYDSFTCFPKSNEIFAAFNYCSFQDTKVVIIGQDPYHGIDQAHGLCFSVNGNLPHPPSLVNIFKEINTDLDVPYPESGNLERWAKQGVLLLNATLTVRAHKPGSHQKKGWEDFTDAVIKKISEEKENVVFLLWGGFAKKKAKLIHGEKHHILTSGHPSPLSANRGYWFGNGHFSRTNEILKKSGNKTIIW